MKYCPTCAKVLPDDAMLICPYDGMTPLLNTVSDPYADTLGKPANASKLVTTDSKAVMTSTMDAGSEISKILQEIITRAVSQRDRGIYTIKVANVEGAQNLVEELTTNGYVAHIQKIDYIYDENADDLIEVEHTSTPDDSQAIWLATNIPPAIAIEAIIIAVRRWHFLRYILLSSEFIQPNDNFSEIYFGGSTEEAVETYKLEPWEEKDFEGLRLDMTINEFHDYVRRRYSMETHLNFVRI